MGMPSIITTRKLFALALFVPCLAWAQTLSFQGTSHPAIELEAPASSGLTRIYVLPEVSGTIASFSGSVSSCSRFSAMGTAYAQPADLSKLEGNVGYAIESEGKTYYFWVVDYSAYPFGLRDLQLDPTQSDCSTVWLDLDGNAERIPYYSITGVPMWLDRNLTLSYHTLEFDEEQFAYEETTHQETIAGVAGDLIHCNAPLCQTDFTLTGDRFTRQWGYEESVTSPTYDPLAIAATTKAVQAERNNDNELKEETALGGSGPADITFRAAVTDAVVFQEWQLARDNEFNSILLRDSSLEFAYTFREQGSFYVRFIAANDDASCEYESDVYEVFIGQSQLKCPNAFSPGASEGVNDEWKVSYKSIVEFDCHIFDRYGRQMAHLTDPSQGWDGKQGGKVVPAGVYFYVIRARGADGKKYKLDGNINILGASKRKTTTSTDATF